MIRLYVGFGLVYVPVVVVGEQLLQDPLASAIGETMADVVMTVCIVVPVLLIGYWFSRPLKRYDRRYREGRCLGCGYPRTGAAMDVCPECGRAWTTGREKAESSD